jgi:hypothetical protein
VANLELLNNEIRYELARFRDNKFKEIDALAIGKFDSTVYNKASHFLMTLNQYYTNRMNKAAFEKERIIDSLTATEEGKLKFDKARERYVNQAVTDAVKNVGSAERIVEYDGKLIQKIYPIYIDEHRPLHRFDFSASLFQPTKHFAGDFFDTFHFNICVIWSMTIILFITLYFDLLKKAIKALEGNRKYRRRDRQ